MIRKEKLINLLIPLLVVEFIAVIAIIVVPEKKINGKQEEYARLNQRAVIALPDAAADHKTTGAQSPVEQGVKLEESAAQMKQIDFAYLQAENPDVYAWIEIPGVGISYPVLQSAEDNYYLDHNFDYSTGRPGCIYSNAPDAKDFTDFASVLYGHDMNNGTMFGKLRQFYDIEYFNEHDTIYIYTQNQCLTYQIIKTREHSDEYLPFEYYYWSDVGIEAFLAMLDEAESGIGHVRIGSTYSENDRFLILSTCVKNKDTRYLIIGKLVEEKNR